MPRGRLGTRTRPPSPLSTLRAGQRPDPATSTVAPTIDLPSASTVVTSRAPSLRTVILIASALTLLIDCDAISYPIAFTRRFHGGGPSRAIAAAPFASVRVTKGSG